MHLLQVQTVSSVLLMVIRPYLSRFVLAACVLLCLYPLELLNADADDLETDPRSRFTLASIYCNQENWEALRTLMPELKKEPLLKDLTHYFKGRLLLSENRIGSARREFEAALKKRPEAMTGILDHIYFYKAYCLKALGQIELAEASFDRAMDNDFQPENVSELIKLAEFLNLFQKPNQTIALIDKYPKSLLEEHAALSAVLGRAYQMQNLHYMAIETFTQSLTIDPSQFLTRTLRANSYRQIGDLERALEDIEAANALLPNQADQQFIHGLILFQMGRLKEAYGQFKGAEETYKSDDSFLVLYASLSQAIGEDDSARWALEHYKELSLSPPNKSAVLMNLFLNPSLNEDISFDPHYSDALFFRLYMRDRLSYKEVLSSSRDASISFYLAQSEKQKENTALYRELLIETLRRSKEHSPENLLALWQLNQKEE